MSYLEAADGEDQIAVLPLDELELWLQAQDYHVAEMERAIPAWPEALVRRADGITSAAARNLATRFLSRYRDDAEAMPLREFASASEECGLDPVALAERFHVDIASVLRRLASLPTAEGAGRIGLVICDGSGTLTFRKPVPGFSIPRFGAACPLWPLYQALSRPMAPVRAVVELAGRGAGRFMTYAICQPIQAAGFDSPQVLEAAMLILPGPVAASVSEAPLPLGTSCRICPRRECSARREPSILADGF